MGLRVSDFPLLHFDAHNLVFTSHPGVDLRANLKSITHRCHLFKVAFAWLLTKETVHFPLARLQSGLLCDGEVELHARIAQPPLQKVPRRGRCHL